MPHATTNQLIQRALQAHTVIPGFNIPYLPIIEPVVQALKDCNSFGLVSVAELEWAKFESKSLEAVRDEYNKFKLPRHTRLHLDHIPVINEDNLPVDYAEIIGRALGAGYESVMVDGSRLPFEENVACTKKIVDMAHAVDIPVEAELGAILGHGAGPLPPYEELFESGKGFADPDEAKRFVDETGVDWLSVAIGNIHGAISAATKDKKKIATRLNIEHLDRIYRKINIPIVLHGGTGIRKEYIMESIQHGIAKINVAAAIRLPYEQTVSKGVGAAQDAVYNAMLTVLRDDLEVQDSANLLNPEE